MRPLLIALGSLLLAADGSVQAQTNEPKPLLPSGFRSFIVVDKRPDALKSLVQGEEKKTLISHAGQFHCLVCEAGLNPTIAVFSRSTPTAEGDPLFALLRKMEALVTEKRNASFSVGAFIIFLTLDNDFSYVRDPEKDKDAPDPIISRDKKISEVDAVFKKAEKVLSIPFGLAAKNAPEAAAFKIAGDDEITVIVYSRMREVQRWGFKKGEGPTEADLAAIQNAVISTLPAKRSSSITQAPTGNN